MRSTAPRSVARTCSRSRLRQGSWSSQLDAAARAYVNHPRGADVEGGELIISSIYVWYAADFGGDDVSIIAHLRRYADAALDRALAGRSKVDNHSYDWALNDDR